jgi:two-component system nitrogen regulation sensor histidine kinase NtrY
MYRKVVDKISDATLAQKITILMGGVVAITPTILIAIIATLYYYIGIEGLFDEKIKGSLSETVKIAQLYADEHKNNIKTEVLDIARDIDRNYYALAADRKLFDAFLEKQAKVRNMSEAVIFSKRLGIIARTRLSLSLSLSLSFELPPERLLHEADSSGSVVVLGSSDNDRVRAMIKIDNFPDTYLIVGRRVDKNIMDYMESTQKSATYYDQMRRDIKNSQAKLQLIFVISSLMLLAGAIWIAIRLARKIARPINQLVEATEKIALGDLSVRVPERDSKDETAKLEKAFNKMAGTLAVQTKDLVKFNQIIDERRRFIEAVLRSVASGIITVNPDGIISLANDAANLLLQSKELVGKNFADIIPNGTTLLNKIQEAPMAVTEENIPFKHRGKKYYLLLRITSELADSGDIQSYIVNIHDITALIQAQRSAAWADIARRIAHEIKNPLTPISLAAEQIHRKFKTEIKSNPEAFKKYVDTIVRNVNDIGRMVEDFVSFAKITKPILKRENLINIISDVIFMQQNAWENIEYTFDKKQKSCYILCDRAQISQVVINLLKNAAESIVGRVNKEGRKSAAGHIKINLDVNRENKTVTVIVKDNGMGFAGELIDQVTEPYVTTKEMGTGLGLSIVRKILDDHKGTLHIETLPEGGAEISFTLKLVNEETN